MNEASPRRRVVIVDDHAMFRTGVRAELEKGGVFKGEPWTAPEKSEPAKSAPAAKSTPAKAAPRACRPTR